MKTKDFQEKLNAKFPNRYEVLSEYIKYDIPIKIKCKKCNYEYSITPHHILSGRKCAKCSKRKKLTTEEFKEKVKEFTDDYEVIGEYTGCHNKIKMKHLKCGKTFSITPNNFLNTKCGCTYCFKSFKKTTKEFKKEVNTISNDYEVLSEYTGCHNKIKMKHLKCGNEFLITPRHFLNGNRCPKCKHSKIEDKIETYLKNNKIKYKTQVYFKECKYKSYLYFDFQIFINNDDYILLEYDGEFHYQNIFYEEENRLELQQIRDNIKNEFCKKFDINLIRISYKNKKNINTILENLDKEYNFKREI